MFVLLITISDFGRFFASGITLESAARTAAEVAAQELTNELAAGVMPDYTVVHRYAWSSVCDETKGLPNVTYSGSFVECDGVPTIVCVHDGADPDCTNVYNGAGGIPTQCGTFDGGAAPNNAATGGTEISHYVEVRVCYRFSTLFDITIPFIGGQLSPISGDFFLERVRMFTVADY